MRSTFGVSTCYRSHPSKHTELKHLMTDQTGNKKTYCQDESGIYEKRSGNTVGHFGPPTLCCIYKIITAQGTALF